MSFQKGHKSFKGTEITQFKKGEKPWNTGLSRKIEKACMSCNISMLVFPSQIERQKYCSLKCREQFNTLWNKRDKKCFGCNKLIMRRSKSCRSCHQIGLKRPYASGENNNNWKGGITSENMAIRRSSQYKRWARLIKERDDFTCQLCGIRGGILHSDHIKPFAEYPNLRLDINNGRTLCVDCHRGTPSWGRPQKGGGAHVLQG